MGSSPFTIYDSASPAKLTRRTHGKLALTPTFCLDKSKPWNLPPLISTCGVVTLTLLQSTEERGRLNSHPNYCVSSRIIPDKHNCDEQTLSGIAVISSFVAVPFLLKEGSHEITTPVDD